MPPVTERIRTAHGTDLPVGRPCRAGAGRVTLRP